VATLASIQLNTVSSTLGLELTACRSEQKLPISSYCKRIERETDDIAATTEGIFRIPRSLVTLSNRSIISSASWTVHTNAEYEYCARYLGHCVPAWTSRSSGRACYVHTRYVWGSDTFKSQIQLPNNSKEVQKDKQLASPLRPATTST